MATSFARRLKLTFMSGKKQKWAYYLRSYARIYSLLNPLRRVRLAARLASAARRPDYDYILRRRDYYCKLSQRSALPPGCGVAIGRLKVDGQKVYPLDTLRYARHFNPALKLCLLPGDVTCVPPCPSIVKSRPIAADNDNSVVMKLDRVRHFIFVNDHLDFARKKDIAIFRGRFHPGSIRNRFMDMYFGHPMVDAGDVARRNPAHPEWIKPKLTIREHLDYKFILCLEGNDVASNLKWVMSSNSIAVMPPPVYETWFMEGTLLPGVHYIALKPDLSDLPAQLHYYLGHPEECRRIIDNAHRYVAQFRDNDREDIISLLVLDKYFRATGSTPSL